MTDVLRLDLTREQATIIHGSVQLHIAKNHLNVGPAMRAKVISNIPKWTEQAKLTETLAFNQDFGKLMRRISTFIDGEPPR